VYQDDPDDRRIDMLFREFTAASLGKIDDQYDDEIFMEFFL